jgi:hypothetical protein
MNNVLQRADYTFKYNRNLQRHGWLRLTPAYSVKLVHELVEEILTKPREELFLLDPFSGTATTGVVAAQMGISSHLFDINPFLIWLGNIKCANYSVEEISYLRQVGSRVIAGYKQYLGEDNWAPEIHNIERWWSKHTLQILTAIRHAIVEELGEVGESVAGSLIWLGFCRLAIDTSAAAFNHVSMSFHQTTASHAWQTIDILFTDILNTILTSASYPLPGSATVFQKDSRTLKDGLFKYTDVITSPPYPNRISYIRELRPYMYWTGFLKKAQEAGELDWQAIGGTWGIATSRLKEWQPEVSELPEGVIDVCHQIENSEEKNALLMSRYVHKYFHDMHLHLDSLRHVLEPGARLQYIVGNSSFYGINVETQQLLADLMTYQGYRNVTYQAFRKRNSKKELLEYCVAASFEA